MKAGDYPVRYDSPSLPAILRGRPKFPLDRSLDVLVVLEVEGLVQSILAPEILQVDVGGLLEGQDIEDRVPRYPREDEHHDREYEECQYRLKGSLEDISAHFDLARPAMPSMQAVRTAY